MPNIEASSSSRASSHYARSDSEQSGVAVPNKTTITNVTNVAATTNAMSERYSTHTFTRQLSAMPLIRHDIAQDILSKINTLNANHQKFLANNATQSLFFDPDCDKRFLDNLQNLTILRGGQLPRFGLSEQSAVVAWTIDNSHKNFARYFTDLHKTINLQLNGSEPQMTVTLLIEATNETNQSYYIILPEILSKQENNKIVFENVVRGADDFIKSRGYRAKIFVALVLKTLLEFLQRNNPDCFDNRYIDSFMQRFPRLEQLMQENSAKLPAARKEEDRNPTPRQTIAMSRANQPHLPSHSCPQ